MENNKIFLFGDYSQAEARVVAWAGPILPMQKWFTTGEDIHLNVARLIGRAVHEHKIRMPQNLWEKPPDELTDKDPERQLAKSTVHGNNYDMGAPKFAYITGLPINVAKIVQDIYHMLFPQIRGNYHVWIKEQLRNDRTITNPFGWRRTFYDISSSELDRTAYAWYPQSTIGLLTIKTLCDCCEIFREELSTVKIFKPSAIRKMGLNVQLQVHDSIGVCLDNDPELIARAARIIKRIAEHPINIRGENIVIPMDFKYGPTWGDQKKYIIPDAA